jgi:acylphosphatase
MEMIRRRVVVRGRVQGVGYRWSCKSRADQLGLAGWVRNRFDGGVELEAEGDERAVDGLEDWCRRGPGPARVTGIDVVDIEPRGDSQFTIRH